MQVLPEAQVVGPVYPVPPHCPHFATVPPAELEVEVAFEEVVGEDPPTDEDELLPVLRVPV